MNVGLQIRRAREYRGLSQSDLAELVGCYQPDISAWENGRYIPNTPTLARIAEALHIQIQYFYSEDAHPTD